MQRLAPAPSKVRWRRLALPNEHGAWAFLLEPALLGLGVAPTAAGAALAGAGLAALLVQHPVSLVLADFRRRRRYPRTLPAATLAAGYGSLALSALVAAFLLGARPAAGLVLVPALVLALVQLAFAVRNRGREVAAELAGALALGALAAAVVLAAGGPWALALGLWLVAAARTVPSILYVRARLRLQRGAPAARGRALTAHGVALALMAVACGGGLLPWLALLPFVLLLARAAAGLRAAAPALPAKTVGTWELGYGLTTVAAVLAGVWLGW